MIDTKFSKRVKIISVGVARTKQDWLDMQLFKIAITEMKVEVENEYLAGFFRRKNSLKILPAEVAAKAEIKQEGRRTSLSLSFSFHYISG